MDLISVREPSFWLLPGLRCGDRRYGLLLVARDAVGRLREQRLEVALSFRRDAPDHAPALGHDHPLRVAALSTFIASV